MIYLSKSNLIEIARTLVLANTSYSLYKGLLKTAAVENLRKKVKPNELKAHYDKLTTRAKTSEFSIGLAYACLVGILLNDDDDRVNMDIDPSRLTFGQEIELLAKNEEITRVKVFANASEAFRRPSVVANSSSYPSSGIIIQG